MRPARQTKTGNDVEDDDEADVRPFEDEVLEDEADADPRDKVGAADTEVPRTGG